MTIDELLTMVRQRLADVTDESYDDELLLSFYNLTAKDFAQTGCCQAMDTITTGSGITTYDLTSLTYTHLNIYSVRYNYVKLDFAPRWEADRWDSSTNRTPSFWSVWGNTMYFDTTFNVQSADPLEVFYVYVPDDATSVDTVVAIPDKWTPALLEHILYQCRDTKEQAGLGDRALQIYLAHKETARRMYEMLLGKGGYT